MYIVILVKYSYTLFSKQNLLQALNTEELAYVKMKNMEYSKSSINDYHYIQNKVVILYDSVKFYYKSIQKIARIGISTDHIHKNICIA